MAATFTTVLAGDIGGTKSVLRLFAREGDRLRPLRRRRFANRDFDNFSALLDAFLADLDRRPETAAFAVAGPVEENRCRMTNLDWEFDGDALAAKLGTARVALLNDVEATAYATLLLPENAAISLQRGQSVRGACRAVIAAGTGLGEAVLLEGDTDRKALAGEGGHADFAPTDAVQIRLLERLLPEFGGHVSIERLLSGNGIGRIYDFFCEEMGVQASPAVMNAADRNAAVTQQALRGSDEIAVRTLRLFSRIYGAEAGNLALRTLARGGIWIGGGIAPKILPFLHRDFLPAFLAKGRFEALLRTIPVQVVLDEDVAVLGAAYVAAGRSVTRVSAPV